MQTGFIFLVIIWASSTFASGHTSTHLQFSLGCQAVISCQHKRSGSNGFKWFFKKDYNHNTIRIYFQDKKGLQYHNPLFRHKMRVLHDGSLVIDRFTEDDEGLYWCDNCLQDNCRKQSTVIRVKKEILMGTRETVYVIEGSSFTHACLGELTDLKWTFEESALKNSVQRPELDFVDSNKSIHIVNVKRTDAGKYFCWKSGCDGYRQKLLTINLCVITVHGSEDSSASCAVICDLEFSNIKPNVTLNMETGSKTISVLVDQYGSLNCSVKHMFKGHSTVNSTHNSTHNSTRNSTRNSTDGSSNASNTTTGVPTEPEYLNAVIYGTPTALLCLILIALLAIWYLRPRLHAAFPLHICCCGFSGRMEAETSVIYSSIIIRKPAKITNSHMTNSDSSCVYSVIKA